jgi:hypothetical protein
MTDQGVEIHFAGEAEAEAMLRAIEAILRRRVYTPTAAYIGGDGGRVAEPAVKAEADTNQQEFDNHDRLSAWDHILK